MDSHLLFYKQTPIEVLITKMATIHDSRYVIQLPDLGFVLQQTIDGKLQVQGSLPSDLDKELLTEIITLVKTTYKLKQPVNLPDFLITIEVNGVPVRLVVKQTTLSALGTQYTVIAKNKILILKKTISPAGSEWQLVNGTVQDQSGLQKIIDQIEHVLQ